MNIAEILKYCPKGTKLYSLVDGEVTLKDISDPDEYPIKVGTYNGDTKYYTKDGLFFTNRPGGECVLFPSKEQRDWNKFRLPVKRGDIMMSIDGKCPFIATGEMDNNSPKYVCGINSLGGFKLSLFNGGWTSEFYIPAPGEAKKELFIKMKRAGYKWNADTLELEKIEPKFKEGDVLINKNTNKLFLFTGGIINDDVIQGYLLFANNTFESYGLPISSFKLASSEDRDKVYFTLAKKGYKYDKEQHKIIKQTFKPFDMVLVRDTPSQKWSINLFSYYDEEDEEYPYVCLNERYSYCIPYEGNEYLVGTKDI